MPFQNVPFSPIPRGFARYLALGILGRNLHTLGKLLIAQEAAACEAARSQRQQSAA